MQFRPLRLADHVAHCGAMLVTLAAACGEPDAEPYTFENDEPVHEGCGDLHCESGFWVSLVAVRGGFEPGVYEVAANVGETQLESCMFEIAADEVTCGDDRFCVSNNTCDARFQFIAAPHSIGLRLGAQPSAFELQVLHRGQVLLSTYLAPSYETYYPNGSDCEPACARGDATVDLHW